ncbi:MAG: hypothetical protein H6Q55_1230 [Deltaproteobacteria bacterium]|nr:hypothetical protein [Deltaproteobacteria bacterium]
MKTMDRRDFFKTSALTGAALISGTLSSSVGQSAYAASKTKSRSRAGEVPVAAEADVVVIGGGPAGFGAAVRAARAGAKTILIDRYDVPGGVHTVGLQGAYNAGVGGIHTELMQRLTKEGHVYTATEKTLPDLAGNPLSHYEWYLKPGSTFSRSTFNPDSGGTVMLTMLREAGVKALYNTTFVDLKMKKPPKGEMSIESVIVKNVAGTQAVKGKVFIDASGMAEVVARAGAPFVPGGGGQPGTVAGWDGKNRPVPGGLLWIMTGIDFDKVVHYQKNQNDPSLAKLISAALAANDIPPDLFRPRLGGTNVYANLYIGHPTLDLSPIQGPGTFILWENVPYEWSLHLDENRDDMLRAQIAMREFVNAEARFLKHYVPGFENGFVTSIGHYLGVRDGRHPKGEYVFTLDDALTSRRFPDAVTKPMKKSFHWDAGKVHEFEVPYRCFLPQKVENLLLTGASLSFTYDTLFMVMRNFPWCAQTGEIAGFAAAKSVAQGVPPKQYKWTTPLL